MNTNAKRLELLHGLAHLLEVDGAKVVPEARLADLGPWDSMSVMQTVVLIDEVCGRVVHGREVAGCQTVADIIALAERP